MAQKADMRALALDTLIDLEKNRKLSHVAVRETLMRHQFLARQDRAFYTRLVEGVTERRIYLDYVIDQFSRRPAAKCKPLIRSLLRMGVYQILFMDVPDAAACSEAVKLARKRHFSGLTGFVNGVLRNVSRGKTKILLPDPEKDYLRYLSVSTSTPEWLTALLLEEYGRTQTEGILQAFLDERPLTIRTCTNRISPEELKESSPDALNEKLVAAFQYDDFAWQKERGIRIPYKGRAEGLHKVLYQCPHCKTEFQMDSKGAELFCKACGKRWSMSELSELSAQDGETEFSHIPDWYEWERENVRREVEAGTYSSGVLPVTVDTLPNAKKFIRLGEGTLVHDMEGFTVRGTDVDGDPFEMLKPVPSLYSCHIEYEYLGKFGDCVDLNTLEDTWYIYPHDCAFSVTKMALATEELYFAHRRAIGRPCKPGLA